jgi:hypothetical protein
MKNPSRRSSALVGFFSGTFGARPMLRIALLPAPNVVNFARYVQFYFAVIGQNIKIMDLSKRNGE